jgi:HlyD family secretion protein
MTKKRILILSAICVSFIIAYFLFSGTDEEKISITVKVERTTFKSEVIISGEAQSTSSKKIKGPNNLQKFKIRSVKIQDLITEGTIIKEGDYVGRLDASDVNEKIIDAGLNLETAQSKYIQQKLDTTLSLKKERNGIEDLIFNMEESKLELKQSTYETPATIRKLEIGYDKFERDLREKKEDYHIKKRQAEAKMVEVGTEVSKINKEIASLKELKKSFIIHSESSGMITYVNDYNGKRKVGSDMGYWDPTIANLPDLTKMESKTYANEVDIRKIKKDLTVKIGFDAFPDIELDGVITSVANVGEKKRGSDIKIFPIKIKLSENNNNIRPGMTTSNRILTSSQEDVLTIPLEAVFAKDSIKFAYIKKGFSVEKKQIELGMSNNDIIIVKEGLKEKDVVYLTEPEGYVDQNIKLLK